MLIALLAFLGVDLIVLVALVVGLIARRRWLKRQPGDFRGAIRVADGEVDGLGPKCRRGHGRWVRDVLVWSKAPLLLGNELVPIDGVAGERNAEPGEAKRLGDSPVVVDLTTNGATVQVATKQENRELALGPLYANTRERMSPPAAAISPSS